MSKSRPQDHIGSEPGDAYEFVPGNEGGRTFLTCEHASARIPSPWSLSGPDERLLGTHWACDLGAAELTRDLARVLGAPAVLATCSRLIVDVNRPEDSDTLFREYADDVTIALNANIDANERDTRLRRFYHPYHQAIDRYLEPTACEIVFAVHSFTPLYEGNPRAMEIGVLFDLELELADATARALRDAGFVVAMNEPYSGRDGLMYSAEWHAARFQRRPIEIEVRQDIADDPNGRERVVRALVGNLGE